MPDTPAYQVLARKYRPQTFADLIGQEAMVRTLRNAFQANRIAHAFVMTGVRGVGKTTTARIIAKGLNCIGPAGANGPTIDPCGECGPCRAIAEGRHVDVLEYDAASNTQVDKMREILASIPYRPTEARYKIIIFDEVHMLSSGSFNALLKTLEEPPAHVKFIFATTEIRKVPVTILSRCQRYDLRRIEPEVMMAHLDAILAKEGAHVAQDALALITRAAEGSVRDALSLLDQAIAHGAGETSADQVRAMLGLADRGRVLDLFDLVMQGNATAALSELSSQYADGADPMAVLRDLAEITHWISVIKITPDAADDPTTPPDERTRGLDMAARLPMRALTRMWQMLLKALEEVALAPNAMMAAEMAIIRLTHVADLPDPESLIRKLQSLPQPAATSPTAPRPAPNGTRPTGTLPSAQNPAGTQGPASQQGLASQHGPVSHHGPASQHGTATATALAPEPLPLITTFDQIAALIREKRDMKLLVEVETTLRLVHFAPGRIEFQPTSDAPKDLAARLAQRLQSWTGVRWGVSVTGFGGGATIAEQRNTARNHAEDEVRQLPLVQAVLAAFPGAKITDIRTPQSLAATAAIDALPVADDDWDPFEDN